MIPLFATSIITCSQALGIANRLTKVVGLSITQRTEIMKVIKEYVPNCPIIIQSNSNSLPKK